MGEISLYYWDIVIIEGSYELKCDTGLYNIILLDGDNYTSERSGTSDIITSKQYDDL